MVGLFAAVGAGMSALAALVHQNLVWVTIAVAAMSTGLAAYLAMGPAPAISLNSTKQVIANVIDRVLEKFKASSKRSDVSLPHAATGHNSQLATGMACVYCGSRINLQSHNFCIQCGHDFGLPGRFAVVLAHVACATSALRLSSSRQQ
jgi:hypothetical protein